MSWATLPGIQLSWSAASLAGGDTFVSTNVKRRLTSAGGAYTRIAAIASAAITSWLDVNVAPATQYDYVISTTVLRSGVQIESPNSSSVIGSVTFSGRFLHTVDQPATYLQVLSNAGSADDYQDQAFIAPWGSRNPTLYTGTAQTRHWKLTFVPTAYGDPTWVMLETLFGLQLSGHALCYRAGDTGEFAFVSLSGEQHRAGFNGQGSTTPLVRTDKIGSNQPAIDLIESKYTMGV